MDTGHLKLPVAPPVFLWRELSKERKGEYKEITGGRNLRGTDMGSRFSGWKLTFI